MRATRTVLFVPGGRADMIAKAPRSSPDVIVVDLEDAVAQADKDTARRTATGAVDELDAGDAVVLVRVNPPASPWFPVDVAAVAASRAAGVVLPKLERAEDLAAVRAMLPAGAMVFAGIETALGVADCRPLLRGGVDAVYFGAEDYIADLGGRRSAGGAEVLHARSRVVLAARLAAVPAVDQAVGAVGAPPPVRGAAAPGRARR
ncbi:MAG: aldolase/citrate lyase family protein, partial [Pseudonocardia sp.]|nr:aldolase/citrate lyase family protein [Pseudonocardia sp.]